jgi:anti-anti-sigma regulatory factor
MVSLIGKVNSERAQEVMEAILKKVLNTESKIVILDILGVYPVDSEVASHLIKITKATRLMGCDCVITGVTPSISQTFVNLGVELGEVITSSNLKDGLERAFGMLDLEVRVAMYIAGGCLLAPLQVDLSDEAMLEIQAEILEKVSQTGVKGVIIDLTSIDILDSFMVNTLSNTGRMASLLGATTVIVGLKPELASVLVDLNLEFKDILTAITLEQGFQKLRPIIEPDERPEEIEETEESEEDKSEDVACEDEI